MSNQTEPAMFQDLNKTIEEMFPDELAALIQKGRECEAYIRQLPVPPRPLKPPHQLSDAELVAYLQSYIGQVDERLKERYGHLRVAQCS